MTRDSPVDALLFIYYLFVMALPVAFLAGFTILVARTFNASWLSRIRRLLEEQGFRVREIKRLWFHGEYRGSRPIERNEWLAYVVLEDRDGRVKSGWVHWHRLLPWQGSERWSIEWDDRTQV
jgi:hypothetical protein